MQDAHTFTEPAIPGGSTSFSAFWGLSTKGKSSLLLAAGGLLKSASPWGQGGHSPGALTSVSAGGWAAEPVPTLSRCPEAAAQTTPQAFCQASPEQGSSMESLIENCQIGVL